MSVSGSVADALPISVDDALEVLRAHLTFCGPVATADHTANVTEISGPKGHLCYAAAREIVVSSSVEYELIVPDRGRTDGLHFLADPASCYVACGAGEPLSDTMSATGSPAGVWAVRQDRTARRGQRYAPGRIAGSDDDPLTVLASSTFSFIAHPVRRDT